METPPARRRDLSVVDFEHVAELKCRCVVALPRRYASIAHHWKCMWKPAAIKEGALREQLTRRTGVRKVVWVLNVPQAKVLLHRPDLSRGAFLENGVDVVDNRDDIR